MPDFPIDPELRIHATPSIVLRRTTEAVDFIRKLALSSSDRAWRRTDRCKVHNGRKNLISNVQSDINFLIAPCDQTRDRRPAKVRLCNVDRAAGPAIADGAPRVLSANQVDPRAGVLPSHLLRRL